ncbi:hypothetical protein P22_0514 [Propionispora sp. 2/2-37]|uniref:DUF1659 domain-containing protein n=1 Tax=Propionispora sp. 2/2-37 TaxID=1677858 RepID=UPI0006BB8B87|nr:DUF1659 domain-containing protein [Propionispora sp. 2/2-37]CUH94448.1 hypothetical protein P22_0514 [Propionispora sp. 2/2-37]
MAIVKAPQSSRLELKVQTGTDDSGKPVYRVRSFTNLGTGAADADVYAVGQAIGELQQHPVISIGRQDDSLLVNE